MAKTVGTHEGLAQCSSGNEYLGEKTGEGCTENDHANDKQTGNHFCKIYIDQATQKKRDNHQAYQQGADGSEVDGQINKTTPF